MAASKHSNIHTHVHNAVTLVWGSLRLAPTMNIIGQSGYSSWSLLSCACLCTLVFPSLYPQTGESLVDGGHYASDDIEAQVEELFQKWEELREATEEKGVGLQQALSLVHFNRKVDGVQVLVRDRVAVANSQETGRDLEHCQVLTKKFDDFQKVGMINCLCLGGIILLA